MGQGLGKGLSTAVTWSCPGGVPLLLQPTPMPWPIVPPMAGPGAPGHHRPLLVAGEEEGLKGGW